MAIENLSNDYLEPNLTGVQDLVEGVGGFDHEEEAIYPQLPQEFIKIIPHPHSQNKTAKIIPLNSTPMSGDSPPPILRLHPEQFPWAPFDSLADFEYTEMAVLGLLTKDLVNKQLHGMNSTWATGSHLSLKSYADMEKALQRARGYFVQFQKDSVSANYLGETYTFTFEYRDPWEWIIFLIKDEHLAAASMWNSARKYYCCHGRQDRIYDEPNTGDTWWEVDCKLPGDEVYPHCYLPLHFWLDKGLVTRRLCKYPMVLRPAWLPSEIRNASGNGGGVLVGYMPMIPDPDDPDRRPAAEQEAFAQFKREVYQKVLQKVFRSVQDRSHNGEGERCGDGVERVLHPGILILSQDAQEAACFCGNRAATATHPCPKCLVSHNELHHVLGEYTLRTTENIQAAVQLSRKATTKKARAEVLVRYGIHDVEHFLWAFRFSDPYKAVSYDTLHSDDIGKWGKHLWPLLLKILEDVGGKGTLARRMAAFPRWSNLKHFQCVTTTNYADGQAFYDILKCIIPCIVDLLPKNSVLIHCLRAYIHYRILIGLRCVTDSRLECVRNALSDYERCCEAVSKKYGKDFNFLKQHAPNHVVQDIREKGSTSGFSTRTGEGFQQEAAQAFRQTNMKDAEHQMSVIDEKQEAIARIRMAIDNDKKACLALSESDRLEGPDNSELLDSTSPKQWKFGSPEGRRTNLHVLTSEQTTNRDYRDLDKRLRNFIAHNIPEEAMDYEDDIFIQRFKCVSLSYQSLEDWTEERDIMRCNPNFHGRPRFDCVVIHDDAPGITISRLRDLLRFWLPSGTVLDVALIHMFSSSKWKPKTVWDGCRVLDEDSNSSLVLMDYVLRGALVFPVSNREDEKSHYHIDTTDPDMFLRTNY